MIEGGDLEDFLLREKKPEVKGTAIEGSGAEGEGDHGHPACFPCQSAHLPDVLLVVAGEDDGAGAEEEEGLEPSVGVEVEHPGLTAKVLPAVVDVAAEAHRHDHVAELREGRVCQDALDVILLCSHEGREEGR